MVQTKRKLPDWFKVQAPTSNNFNSLNFDNCWVPCQSMLVQI